MIEHCPLIVQIPERMSTAVMLCAAITYWTHDRCIASHPSAYVSQSFLQLHCISQFTPGSLERHDEKALQLHESEQAANYGLLNVNDASGTQQNHQNANATKTKRAEHIILVIIHSQTTHTHTMHVHTSRRGSPVLLLLFARAANGVPTEPPASPCTNTNISFSTADDPHSGRRWRYALFSPSSLLIIVLLTA